MWTCSEREGVSLVQVTPAVESAETSTSDRWRGTSRTSCPRRSTWTWYGRSSARTCRRPPWCCCRSWSASTDSSCAWAARSENCRGWERRQVSRAVRKSLRRRLDVVLSLGPCVFQALAGEVGMSSELDEVARALFNGQIPAIWRKLAPDTLKSLGNWMIHFKRRYDQYSSWVRDTDPTPY